MAQVMKGGRTAPPSAMECFALQADLTTMARELALVQVRILAWEGSPQTTLACCLAFLRLGARWEASCAWD